MEEHLKLREELKKVMSEEEIVAMEQFFDDMFESITKMIEPVSNFINEIAERQFTIVDLLYKKGIFSVEDLKAITQKKE